jgi:hypothetical protein
MFSLNKSGTLSYFWLFGLSGLFWSLLFWLFWSVFGVPSSPRIIGEGVGDMECRPWMALPVRLPVELPLVASVPFGNLKPTYLRQSQASPTFGPQGTE